MSFLLPILFAGALTGSGSGAPSSSAEFTAASTPRMTLIEAATAAARRESLAIDRKPSPRALAARGGGVRRHRHSVPTRITAIFAGAVLGSFAGLAAGAAVDAATNNGECMTGMKYGMPIGAAVGGFLSARLVR